MSKDTFTTGRKLQHHSNTNTWNWRLINKYTLYTTSMGTSFAHHVTFISNMMKYLKWTLYMLIIKRFLCNFANAKFILPYNNTLKTDTSGSNIYVIPSYHYISGEIHTTLRENYLTILVIYSDTFISKCVFPIFLHYNARIASKDTQQHTNTRTDLVVI